MSLVSSLAQPWCPPSPPPGRLGLKGSGHVVGAPFTGQWKALNEMFITALLLLGSSKPPRKPPFPLTFSSLHHHPLPTHHYSKLPRKGLLYIKKKKAFIGRKWIYFLAMASFWVRTKGHGNEIPLWGSSSCPEPLAPPHFGHSAVGRGGRGGGRA